MLQAESSDKLIDLVDLTVNLNSYCTLSNKALDNCTGARTAEKNKTIFQGYSHFCMYTFYFGFHVCC